ncbi:MAG: tRNA (adenosine(37)-N6)-threonylcarbamoyltransferase complex ATPase subunit type 1 TsaE [Myxococcota bacterium]
MTGGLYGSDLELDVRFDPASLGLSRDPAWTVALPSPEDTVRLGRALAEALEPGDVLGLLGTLGAGKTTLTKGIARALAGEDHLVTSPTYTLVNVYEGQGRGDVDVVHMDLYRLEALDDLESIGYWEYVERGDVVVCVEWITRIPEAWPQGSGGARMMLTLVADGAQRIARLWVAPEDSALVGVVEGVFFGEE